MSPLQKIFFWPLLFSITVFATASSGAPTQETQGLEIWTSSEPVAKAIGRQTERFTKEWGVPVTVTVLNKDLTSQFKTAAVSGKGPDILTWAHDVVGELAASGFLEPIALPAAEKEDFLEVSINAFYYQGQLYGYPYDVEAIALIRNKKLLPTAPASLEELAQLKMKKMAKSDDEIYSFLYDINNFFFSFPILSAGGGYVFGNEHGSLNPSDIGLGNSGAVAGATFLQNLVRDGVIPASINRNIAFEKMKKGQLAATIDGPWALADLKAAKIDFAVSPLPSLGGAPPKPFVGAHGFMIRRSSAHKLIAKELIERYLVSQDGIRALYREDPRGPARKSVLQEVSKDDPHLGAFMESAKVGIPMPNIPQMGAVWASAGRALQFVTVKQKPPEAAMKELVDMIKTSLQK